jgi:uncharacterized protein YjdB
MIAVMAGCGGDDDQPPADTDAGRMDVRSDGADVRTDGLDAASDTRTDTPATPDARPDMTTPDADAPRPPDTQPPPVDVRPDLTPDTQPPPVDVRPDLTPDTQPPPPDVQPPPPDVQPPPPDTQPPPPDADAGGCTADTQCPDSAPHCNTTTGACVSRTGLAVEPVSPSIALGTTRQFTATVTYSDNSTGNATTQVAWSSGTPATATIGANTGLATSVATGTTVITASIGSLTANTTLTVTNATLTGLTITSTGTRVVPIGLTFAFTVTGTYTNNTSQDLTTQATWTSSAPGTATVGTNTGVATGVAVGTATISAAFGGQTADATLEVTAAQLQSLTIEQQGVTIGQNTIQRYTVRGNYSDSSSQVLTNQATWSSSDVSIATVSNLAGSQGWATAVSAGAATITAAFGGQTANTLLTVTGSPIDSITITPASPSVANGLVQQFRAVATYANNTTQDMTQLATWSSTDTAVAFISNALGSQGLATTVSPGVTTINAVFGSHTGTATLTVSSATLTRIEVSPLAPSAPRGRTQQFRATGYYTDATTLDITDQVTWTTNDAGIATVSNATGSYGLATAQNTGTATITATAPGTSPVISADTTFTVTNAVLVSIAVTPSTASVAMGNQVQFTAIATYSDSTQGDVSTTVTWNSSNLAFATISSTGLAYGQGQGAVTITAAIGLIGGTANLTVNAADLVSIAVTPPNPSKPKGTTQQLTATGNYTDGTSRDLTALVSWSSNAANVATVNSTGLVNARNAGQATINAYYDNVNGNTLFTVGPEELTAISVTPAVGSVPAGTDQQFQATGTYTDGRTADITTQVLWESMTTAAATISNALGSQGLAHGVAIGSSTIRASQGTIQGEAQLTVTTAVLQTIQIDPPAPSIAKGTNQVFTATGHYTDGSVVDLTQLVTWSSTVPGTATITNVGTRGVAFGANAGTTSISATYNGVAAQTAATLTVTNATLSSIAVTINPPGAASIAKGTTVQLTATGTYSDNSTQNLTGTATWATSAVAVATVTAGLVTGVDPGAANITATVGAITSNTVAITVTAATLQSITVTPAASTLARGTTRQFTATGNYTGGGTQDITNLVTWTSSSPSFATISNASGSQGLATAAAVGTTTITATLGSVAGNTTLQVTNPNLLSVVITPDNGTVPLSGAGTVQYTATASYSDATSQNITSLCTWGVSNTNASISNASGSKGLATALVAGTVVIDVDCPGTGGNQTDTTNLTITP